MDQLRLQGVRGDVEQGQGHRKFETPPPGTARVQVKTITAPFDAGFVRMASDDEFDVGVEISRDVGNVVGQQGWPAVQLEAQVVGECGGPRVVKVIVAAHGVGRCDAGELREDVLAADVTRVNDQFAILEGSKGFGAQEAVGVGDDGGFHGREYMWPFVSGLRRMTM